MMYHASGVAQRTTQESPTEKVNKFPSLETQPFEGQVMVEQRYYDIILSFIWLVFFYYIFYYVIEIIQKTNIN